MSTGEFCRFPSVLGHRLGRLAEWRDRHPGRGGLPHEGDLRWGQGLAAAGFQHLALSLRSRVKASAARARAGSMVRVYSPRNPPSPGAHS